MYPLFGINVWTYTFIHVPFDESAWNASNQFIIVHKFLDKKRLTSFYNPSRYKLPEQKGKESKIWKAAEQINVQK